MLGVYTHFEGTELFAKYDTERLLWNDESGRGLVASRFLGNRGGDEPPKGPKRRTRQPPGQQP
jgi:hypothetical protein